MTANGKNPPNPEVQGALRDTTSHSDSDVDR